MLAALSFAAAAAVALVRDHHVCESPTFIRRSMLRALRACRLPASVPPQRPERELVRVPQVVLGPLPTMVLGPAGSGKSSALEALAREATSATVPVPAVLVRLNLPADGGVVPASAGMQAGMDAAAASAALIDSAASQIYEQIGYPQRSVLGTARRAWSRRKAMRMGHGFLERELNAATAEEAERLAGALTTLFSVCDELCRERLDAGLSLRDAAPVLLFDEPQVLVRDWHLRKAGGETVLEVLASLIVSYGVDRRAVRIAVAGGAAELTAAMRATRAKDPCWSVVALKDPPVPAVEAALVLRGYECNEARAMTDLCGTRLRHLLLPLEKGISEVSAQDFLEQAAAAGKASITACFRALSAPGAATRLAGTLDAVAVADSAGDSAGGALQRPLASELHTSLRADIAAGALYTDGAGELHFHSRLQARAWAAMRADYVSESSSPLPSAAAEVAPAKKG